MSSTAVPVASAVESVELEVTEESVSPLAAVVTMCKELELADLFKVIKQVTTLAEKNSKGTVSRSKRAVPAKKGSQPKGAVPKQLLKPKAWVNWVLAHAKANGWPEFTVHQNKKDKETGEITELVIEMPASETSVDEEGNNVFVYPNGKQIIPKDAMSLSKHYYTPKTKTGACPELYEEFLAEYVEEEIDESPETASVTSSKVVVKMTAAERDAAAAAAKEAKEAEKAAKKAVRDAAREVKKAEKAAEAAEKVAEKERAKAAKAAEKSSGKKPVAKADVPVAAVKKVTVTAKPTQVLSAATGGAGGPDKKVAAPKATVWSCPADGQVHPWSFKGTKYLRNSDNEVWRQAADGGCGEWVGVVDPSSGVIDDSVPEPEFEDEEEDE